MLDESVFKMGNFSFYDIEWDNFTNMQLDS